MSKSSVRKNLEVVKQALADKYSSLAAQASSKDKRREFLYNTDRYRVQAAKLRSA